MNRIVNCASGMRQRLPHAPSRPKLRDLPVWRARGSLAQLVEQRTLNPSVVGSIPTRPTIFTTRQCPEGA